MEFGGAWDDAVDLRFLLCFAGVRVGSAVEVVCAVAVEPDGCVLRVDGVTIVLPIREPTKKKPAAPKRPGTTIHLTRKPGTVRCVDMYP